MLKELSSIQAYLPFIHAMLADPDFRDPMLATPAQLHQHLLDAHEDPAKRLFGTFDGGTLTGLFSVLVLPEEGDAAAVRKDFAWIDSPAGCRV